MYDELWERSYARYVATKSGDRRMLAAIDQRRGASPEAQVVPAQWIDADISPVMNTIDSLFRGLGWFQ